jgi:hypothetical protein
MVAEELRPTALKALRSAMTIVWVSVGRLMASNLRPRGVAASSRRVEKVVGYCEVGELRALQELPFQPAMRSALAFPPASVKEPPTYSTPGASAFSAWTSALSDWVPGEPASPRWSQPPGPAPDAAVGSEPTRTAATQAERTWVRRNERRFETKAVSVPRFLSIWTTRRERKR